MFYELVYTRCRYGVDVLKGKASAPTEGYKVYGCSSALLNDKIADLPFLVDAAQRKQSYKDPTFMDDAYLYYAPDSGASFCICFHPVPFDPNNRGNYSNRPGDFFNHAIIGDYSDMYPFELFGDANVWYAQRKDKEYYYTVDETDLPIRKELDSVPGIISVEEIQEFISDGRQDLLKQAVSFLIEQFSKAPKDRKYLIIQDNSSENIQLWISAIEMAFSPRMAAGLPFATRLDKFLNNNRYTVNQNGSFQQISDLQDPNQSIRYRSMIVGVHSRDSSNMASVRLVQSSPYVVLDGINKKASFSQNVTDPYYKTIATFDDYHLNFVREFLQMFDMGTPDSAIFELYQAYSTLITTPENPKAVYRVLQTISKYKVFGTRAYHKLYAYLNDSLSHFMEEDFLPALSISNWIQAAASIVGDREAAPRITERIKSMFVETLYCPTDSIDISSFWDIIKRSASGREIAAAAVAPSTFEEHVDKLQDLDSQEITDFWSVYLQCASTSKAVVPEDIERVFSECVAICEQSEDEKLLGKLAQITSSCGINATNLMLNVAAHEDKRIEQFIINYYLNSNSAVISSEKAFVEFCGKLYESGMTTPIHSVVQKYLSSVGTSAELASFLNNLPRMKFIDRAEYPGLYELIDARIDIGVKGMLPLALQLQQTKPIRTVCVNSAHLAALDTINSYRKNENLITSISPYIQQGFPSVNNPRFAGEMANSLLHGRYSVQENSYIIKQLIFAPTVYYSEMLKATIPVAQKRKDIWNLLLDCADRCQDDDVRKELYVVLIDALADSGESVKYLGTLRGIISNQHTESYYWAAAQNAIKRIEESKDKRGGLRGLFRKN